MTNDPRQALREGSMTSFQVVVVVICVVLNMVDGFDVLAMSFTAPLVAENGASIPRRSACCCPPVLSAWGRARSSSRRSPT